MADNPRLRTQAVREGLSKNSGKKGGKGKKGKGKGKGKGKKKKKK